MRIAYLASPTTANAFYRAVGPMTALATHRGHDVRSVPVADRPSAPTGPLDDVDVLHIHRFCEERALRAAREAKAHGAAVVWDNDDNLLAVPKGVARSRISTGLQGQRLRASTRRLLQEAHLVTAPSAQLVEQFRRDGAAQVAVIENFLADEFLQTDRRPHAGVTIGWTAGLQHAADVEPLGLQTVLQRLLDERPDVRVVSLGLRLGLRGERYEHVPVVALNHLTQKLAEFDVGIAPLSDIAFNRARSNVKLKEYAAAGVPWLASPIGPYADMGEQQGGRLVPDDGWHDALVRLIEKPRERRKLAKRGVKWAAGQTFARQAHLWERCFEAAIQRARAGAAV